MKRFELQISVFIDAEDEASMGVKFDHSGLHNTLNQIDGDGHYNAEVVDWFELRHEDKSELNEAPSDDEEPEQKRTWL